MRVVRVRSRGVRVVRVRVRRAGGVRGGRRGDACHRVGRGGVHGGGEGYVG